MKRRLFSLLLSLSLVLSLLGCGAPAPAQPEPPSEPPAVTESTPAEVPETPAAPEETAPPAEAPPEEDDLLPEDGWYYSKEEVALYIHTYGHLPGNFVTKEEARSAGWEGGGLDDVLPGMCIGGDRFGNREGLLPEATGRSWTECDVNTLHAKSRGAERIVFSNDGLIYYTGDHYDSFELLYDGK